VIVRYAVIGDSIQWGQGLWEEDKFSSLVADEIEREYGMSAECVARYAHSAAALGSSTNDPDAPRTDQGDPCPGEVVDPLKAYEGEVPFDAASIYSQLNTLKAVLDPEDEGKDNLDLLLVDGGINPDPFQILLNPTGSADELVKVTWDACHETMGKLLVGAATKFQKAHIVVTGYYPIFSEKSYFSFAGVFLAGMLTAYGLARDEIIGIFESADWQANLIALSEVWAEESADALRQAVSDTGLSRVSYAHVDFGPENCLFAPSHWLWGFGSLPPLPDGGSLSWDDWDEVLGWILTLLGSVVGLEYLRLFAPADPVRNEREGFCEDLDKNTDKSLWEKWGDRLFCDWASVGHPNETGAEKYRDAIMQALAESGFDPRPKWVEPIAYLSMSSRLGTHGSAALPAILHPLEGADVLPAILHPLEHSSDVLPAVVHSLEGADVISAASTPLDSGDTLPSILHPEL
jgi:hypothetical protein